MLLMNCTMLVTVGADDKYAEILEVDDSNAYALIGSDVVENGCEFLDGIEMGITDTTHPLYSEVSTEQGIDGRKFSAGNYATFRLDPSKFEGSDEFLVNITYFDYGPYQGSFHFEYIDKQGKLVRIKVIKPGTVQQFNTECICISDIDLTKSMDITGGNFRLYTGGVNLFKKVEIIDLSKFKNEGKSIDELKYFPLSEKKAPLVEYQLIDENNGKYDNANMKNSCTYEEAYELFTKLSLDQSINKPAGYQEEGVLTQKDLVLLALDAAGLDAGETPVLDFATQKGIIKAEDFVYAEHLPASYYSLVALANNVLYYKNDKGDTRLEELFMNGFWSEEFIKTNPTFISMAYKYPKYLPYETITENATGQTYHYMNILGLNTLRTYVTTQSWNSAGTGFICGFVDGELFYYNTETQMLHFIDKARRCTWPERMNAVMGTDDYIYYAKVDEEGHCGIYKVDPTVIPSKPELVGERKDFYVFDTPHISNDCKYFSVDVDIPGLGTSVSRYSVEDDEWLDYHKEFSYSNKMTHILINPGYPDIVSFAHELININPQYMYDRMWQIDFSSGEEAENLYKQGVQQGEQMVMQGASHEVWSNNGEYMYVINIEMGNPDHNVGLTPSSVRYNKDGSHRQYFYDFTAHDHQDKHLYPTGDDKFIVADGNYVVLISQETHERFPISRVEWNGRSSHPYHPHPVVARDKYVVNWGAVNKDDVLGIKWFDFTELAKQQAEGGRYEAGENIERISYKGLDSESSELTYKGRKAILVKQKKSVYLDISDDLIDTDNGKIKISFDYFDNGRQPIKLSYTSGVRKDNDRWRVYDNYKTIKRTNTNKWKHCEIVIDSGNFENIGKHFSDIKITGSSAKLYISNLNVSIPE